MRSAGRLLLGVRADPLPGDGRSGIFYRPVRIAAAATRRRGRVGVRRAARPVPRLFGSGRATRQRDREDDQPRRESRRIPRKRENGAARYRRAQGVRALRAHVAGHQQHGDSVDTARRDQRRLLSADRTTGGQAHGIVEGVGRDPVAGAYARAARLAYETRQGDLRIRRTAEQANRAVARDSVAGQVRRSHREFQRT